MEPCCENCLLFHELECSGLGEPDMLYCEDWMPTDPCLSDPYLENEDDEY